MQSTIISALNNVGKSNFPTDLLKGLKRLLSSGRVGGREPQEGGMVCERAVAAKEGKYDSLL